jgi:hypothetical protein
MGIGGDLAARREPVVLFDMDGVLVDFVGGALKAHGKSIPPAEVVWDFPAQIGFAGSSDPAFWGPLSNHDFWAGLEPLPDGMAVFEAVARVLPKERIGFLSSGIVAGSSDGKRAWVAKHLPGWERHLILGTHKALLAAPCKVLVDDHEPNVTGFAAAGGRAVLAPRPWNSRRELTCPRGMFDPVDTATTVLRQCLSAGGA